MSRISEEGGLPRRGRDGGPEDRVHIAICVCTYKRPEMLRRLLSSLREQETGDAFRLSVVVCDNDANGSAADTVAGFRGPSGPPVRYVIEPEQNISLARNRALGSTVADYYACIDDDEVADRAWVLNLHRTIVGERADGVLGPVRPSYDHPPSAWLVRSRIQERREFPTGTEMLDPRHCRTGNVLLSGPLVMSQAPPFDPRYGRTGGEDVDFFSRNLKAGRRFVWCNEAVVHEEIPPSRQKRSYHMRRALLRGVVRSGRSPLWSRDTVKSLAACSAYALALPFVFVLRNSSFMPLVIRWLDHAGKILARLGIKPVRLRDEA